jgi:hypothetical protein
MNKPLAAAALSLPLLALAACATTHPRPSTAPRPAAASQPAQSADARAADAECARFTRISGTITAGTASDLTVGELAATLQVSGIPWANALAAAAKPARGLPKGPTRANLLAVDMTGAAFRLSMVNLDVSDGKSGKINRAWSLVTSALTKAAGACAS